MNDLATTTYTGTELEIINMTDGQSVAVVRAKLQWLMGEAKRLMAMYESVLIEKIEANGPIDVPCDDEGNVLRHYIGDSEKKIKMQGAVKYRSRPDHEAVNTKVKARILEQVIVATGGDLERVAEHLASDCFKPGGLKAVLGDEEWDRQFVVVVEKCLETKLCRVDTRFIK